MNFVIEHLEKTAAMVADDLVRDTTALINSKVKIVQEESRLDYTARQLSQLRRAVDVLKTSSSL